MRAKVIAVLGVLALTLSFTACSNPVEKVIEKALEEQTGDDVDISTSEDGIKVDTKQGSFQAGGEVAKPDDFPADVPYPEDAKLVSALSADGTFMLMFDEVDKSAVEQLQAGFLAAGYNEQYSYQQSNGASVGYEGTDWSAVLFWEDAASGAHLTYTLNPIVNVG